MREYKIKIIPKAESEWQKLDDNIKEQLKKQLIKRKKHPRVSKDKLRKYKDIYKIKLKSKAYRLAYKVMDNDLVITILIIAKRDDIYKKIKQRI